jgi:hypothetical protein
MVATFAVRKKNDVFDVKTQAMKALLGLILFFSVTVFGQSLILEPNQTIKLVKDKLIVDTLELKDGSSIQIDEKLKDPLIRCNYLIVGRHCAIYSVPTNGVSGIGSLSGGKGSDSPNLSFYFLKATILDTLVISLQGGNGGTGGLGDVLRQEFPNNDWHQSALKPQETRARSGDGGSGGKGGNLIISFPKDLEPTVRRVVVTNNGGLPGLAGNAFLRYREHRELDGQIGEDGTVTVNHIKRK